VIVGVVGAGTMGAGIAQVALAAGHEVVLHDIDEAALARGRERVGAGLAREVQKGRLMEPDRDAALGRLRGATTLTDIGAEAEIVIEAALEDLGLKQEIFRALDDAAPADTLLATNTSALSVTAIADATTRLERVLGLHFFNPAPAMALVEVVAAEATSSRALELAIAFCRGLGKEPIPCRDAPGFIVNRVNRPFTLEALRMLETGEADVEAIDRAIRGAGYPMGPFELMDLVGVDVNLAVARALHEAFGGALRFRPSPIQDSLVADGRLGRKAGAGFYRYAPDGSREGLAPLPHGAAEAGSGLGPSELPDRLHGDAIAERIELLIVNEAYHAVAEDVAAPADVDRAMRLGAGHPAGPFERASALGLRRVVERLVALERQHGERFRVAPALWQLATA
jgi:3-hydroxybutyryl-CoA dehydrogenase